MNRQAIEMRLNHKYNDVTLCELLKDFIELKELSRALLADIDGAREALEDVNKYAARKLEEEYGDAEVVPGSLYDIVRQELAKLTRWK